MKSFHEFPNILIHSGKFTSKRGNTETTFEIENYFLDVMLLLTKIRWKWTGWAVLCEILRQSGKRMVIRPYLKGMESLAPTDTKAQALAKLKRNFNATAGPKNWETATPKGKSVLQCGGPNQNQPIAGLNGKGGGSDTIVSFTPAMWVKSDVKGAFGAANAAGPGIKKDEILLHEIVHGMRQMVGVMQCAATPDHPGLDTVEEFMAIVISNVYRSELKLSGLRADHRGFKNLPAELHDPKKFVFKDKNKPTSNYKRLKQLKIQHPNLVTNLKKVPAAFNPFKYI